METFQEIKEKAVDNLLKFRELSTLVNIRNELSERNLCLNCNGTEYDYCESLGAKKAFEEMIEFINQKIKNLTENEQ